MKRSTLSAQPTCGAEGQPACSEAAVEKGDVFSLYLEADSAAAGVYVKLRGKVEVGGAGNLNGLQPGQVRTTFTETPQQPFSELNSAAWRLNSSSAALTKLFHCRSWTFAPAFALGGT